MRCGRAGRAGWPRLVTLLPVGQPEPYSPAGAVGGLRGGPGQVRQHVVDRQRVGDPMHESGEDGMWISATPIGGSVCGPLEAGTQHWYGDGDHDRTAEPAPAAGLVRVERMHHQLDACHREGHASDETGDEDT